MIKPRIEGLVLLAALAAAALPLAVACPGNSSPTAPPTPTSTPMAAATATPIPTTAPTVTPTRSPTPAVTGAVCGNLSGDWEADWTFCTRTQEIPGPTVFLSQTGCAFTAGLPGLGNMTGTISGTGTAIQVFWSFSPTAPCTGTATGVAVTDGMEILFRFDNPAGWSCAGGCSVPPIISFRRDLPTPTPAMRPRR
jgi:hypothetical protein